MFNFASQHVQIPQLPRQGIRLSWFSCRMHLHMKVPFSWGVLAQGDADTVMDSLGAAGAGRGNGGRGAAALVGTGAVMVGSRAHPAFSRPVPGCQQRWQHGFCLVPATSQPQPVPRAGHSAVPSPPGTEPRATFHGRCRTPRLPSDVASEGCGDNKSAMPARCEGS